MRRKSKFWFLVGYAHSESGQREWKKLSTRDEAVAFAQARCDEGKCLIEIVQEGPLLSHCKTIWKQP
jgi:hypothetical protein